MWVSQNYHNKSEHINIKIKLSILRLITVLYIDIHHFLATIDKVIFQHRTYRNSPDNGSVDIVKVLTNNVLLFVGQQQL